VYLDTSVDWIPGMKSTMENISAGVPVICCPYFADQQTNSRYLFVEWGTGLEIDNDVKRDKVAEQIKELMAGEKGKDMRRKALKLEEDAVRATQLGGSSFMNLEKVIKEVLFSREKIPSD